MNNFDIEEEDFRFRQIVCMHFLKYINF